MLIACSIADADTALRDHGADLLVTGVETTDGDTLDRLLLWTHPTSRVKRTFVVTHHKEIAILDAFTHLRLAGIFDQETQGVETLATALGEIAAGRDYWSPGVMAAMIQQRFASDSVLRVLTPTERMVLAVIGDGRDDAGAAAILPLTEGSVRAARESLHHKLEVQHKGELVALATEYGFVIRTPRGIIRPGLARLIATHRLPNRSLRSNNQRPAA